MNQKVDIDASKNEDLRKCRSALHLLLITVMFLFPVQSWAQTDTLEVACDTMVFGKQYERCITDAELRQISFGNRNNVGERHGWWCELRKNGKLKNQTEYIDGHPVRRRWVGGDLWRYDDKGNIISKGKADHRAKKTF